MIKSDAAVMQTLFRASEVSVSEERRTSLARKGWILYGKYCETDGQGICAESFAEYHLWRGELIVARDFLGFLNAQREKLQKAAAFDDQAAAQLAMTEQLIGRVETLFGEDAPLYVCRHEPKIALMVKADS